MSTVHAFLHACLHRATNALTGREDRLRWLYDIHLLALGLNDDAWRKVVERASVAALADSCLSALQASRRLFATPVPAAVMDALAMAAAGEAVHTNRLGHWSYFQLACWRRLPGLRIRLRWLRQLLFPDMAHLRARYGCDGAGALRIGGRRLADGWRRWRGYRPSA